MPQFNHQVEVTRGILEEECSHMLTTFFKELRLRCKNEKQNNLNGPGDPRLHDSACAHLARL